MTLEEIFAIPPYSLPQAKKEALLGEVLSDLTRRHYAACNEYKKIIELLKIDLSKNLKLEELPYLPVSLFKNFELRSVPKETIKKTLTSSGTTGQKVSKIFLDAPNAHNQSKALTEIITSFIGRKRLPLLLLDTEQVKKDRSMYSARGAGITGFSVFGRDIHFALDKNMKINPEILNDFYAKYQNERVLFFGYTYMIWQYLILPLEQSGKSFNFKNGMLFHIGGWKKLKDQAVSPAEFNNRFRGRFGNISVHNYYGMAEQLGSVFVECEYGHMHCSNYSDVIVRNYEDFASLPPNRKGLLQLVSVLPSSYPGHSLLTQDEGEILGIDDCPCGRFGKYFKIYGRVANAELRGCSDTFEKS